MPSPLYCRLDQIPPSADQFIYGVAPSITARFFSSCPSDSTSRWTPCPPENCEAWLQVRLGCIRLSSLCPFRLLHTFRFLRPATYYRRFWIQRSSSERRRDLNPPDQCAAQRNLQSRRIRSHWQLPSWRCGSRCWRGLSDCNLRTHQYWHEVCRSTKRPSNS